MSKPKPRRKHQHDREEKASAFVVHDPGKDLAPKSGTRSVRLEHLLYEEIDRLFRLEVNDRRLEGIIAVSLQLSPDLRNARVMYGLKEDTKGSQAQRERSVQEALQKVTPFLRARVAEALSIKRTPDLHFHRDRVAEGALRAAALLAAERAEEARQAAQQKRAQSTSDEAVGEPAAQEQQPSGRDHE